MHVAYGVPNQELHGGKIGWMDGMGRITHISAQKALQQPVEELVELERYLIIVKRHTASRDEIETLQRISS